MTKTQFIQKGRAEMRGFCMAALMFLTGHVIKARTHARAEIAHFRTQCNIRNWKALMISLQPCASQALIMHLVGKYAISTWARVLAIKSQGKTDSQNSNTFYINQTKCDTKLPNQACMN